MVRWNKSWPSRLYQNSVNYPLCNTSDINKYHPYTPTQPPRHHLDISRRQKTATYANRHQPLSTCTFSHPQTTPGSVCGCLGVSVGVCLVSVSFCWHQLVYGDVWMMSGGGVRGIWTVFMDVCGDRMCLGGVMQLLIPCRLENSHCFCIAMKGRIFFTWPYWDIKISKCPYVSLTKMLGFYNFFVF